MVITAYACPLCQRTYARQEETRKGEDYCTKVSNSEEISILGLTRRCYNILKIARIDTIDDVHETPDSHLLMLKGFGQASLHELRYKLQVYVGQKN